ncbi:interleukin-18 receptor 1-like [Ambystoma mexicanum]|uniref:interleukin-18 receptor 1-like n=1 Tax=Ambystoma mexicanum TaxID=8296 RepID=UPI0037E85434
MTGVGLAAGEEEKDCILYNAKASQLHFKELNDSDSGNYTCIATFSYDGKEYNYTKTTHLKVKAFEEVIKPGIMGDSSVQVIEIGKAIELSCTAFIGFLKSENCTEHTLLYWLKMKVTHPEEKEFMDLCEEKTETPCETLNKIEVVLLYRSLTGKDETIADGKEYDAYVSYPKYSKYASEVEKHFALKILSHTLENHFGYNLCIFDRDIVPGGAIVDDINSFIDKSRRIILILSSNYMCDNVMYELESGLYKSLVERTTKVIIIEYNLQSCSKSMPESLGLLKSSSKVRWKEDRSVPLNSRFWKKMRYLMPAKCTTSCSSTSGGTFEFNKKEDDILTPHSSCLTPDMC